MDENEIKKNNNGKPKTAEDESDLPDLLRRETAEQSVFFQEDHRQDPYENVDDDALAYFSGDLNSIAPKPKKKKETQAPKLEVPKPDAPKFEKTKPPLAKKLKKEQPKPIETEQKQQPQPELPKLATTDEAIQDIADKPVKAKEKDDVVSSAPFPDVSPEAPQIETPQESEDSFDFSAPVSNAEPKPETTNENEEEFDFTSPPAFAIDDEIETKQDERLEDLKPETQVKEPEIQIEEIVKPQQEVRPRFQELRMAEPEEGITEASTEKNPSSDTSKNVMSKAPKVLAWGTLAIGVAAVGSMLINPDMQQKIGDLVAGIGKDQGYTSIIKAEEEAPKSEPKAREILENIDDSFSPNLLQRLDGSDKDLAVKAPDIPVTPPPEAEMISDSQPSSEQVVEKAAEPELEPEADASNLLAETETETETEVETGAELIPVEENAASTSKNEEIAHDVAETETAAEITETIAEESTVQNDVNELAVTTSETTESVQAEEATALVESASEATENTTLPDAATELETDVAATETDAPKPIDPPTQENSNATETVASESMTSELSDTDTESTDVSSSSEDEILVEASPEETTVTEVTPEESFTVLDPSPVEETTTQVASLPTNPAPSDVNLQDFIYGLDWGKTKVDMTNMLGNCIAISAKVEGCRLTPESWVPNTRYLIALFDRLNQDRLIAIQADSIAFSSADTAFQSFAQTQLAISAKLPAGHQPSNYNQLLADSFIFGDLAGANPQRQFSHWKLQEFGIPAYVNLSMMPINEQSGFHRTLIVYSPE